MAINKSNCKHPFHKIHWVGTTVFCNTCNSTLYRELDKITRLEVIDGTGRAYSNWKIKELNLDFQDNNRTLKIFIEDGKEVGKDG